MLKPTSATRIWQLFMRFLWRMLGLSAIIAILGFGSLWATTELPTPTHIRERAALGDTRILDRHGRLIVDLPDPLGTSRRPITLEKIPVVLRQATIAVEDASFYQNPGIDLRGIARAAWQNLVSREIVAGGSTITQQLARGFLLDPTLGRQRSLERKLREIVLALKLTTAYSKDDILALYLNQSSYGGATYGVEAAAWRLFGKPARELDLAESALLAGLPQAPSRLDPLIDGGVLARARQREVLDAMVRTGTISPEQAATAAAEPLHFSDGTCASAVCQSAAPHFVTYVLNQLTDQLGPEQLARGGLTITTTLDLGLQERSQAILARQIALLNQPQPGRLDHNAHNGAVIVIDPSDGAILTMVGSPDFHDTRSQGQVNAATAARQPGSALKPLTYAAAFERGWTPASIVLDIPTSFPTREGLPYRPQNYDRSFYGPLSVREALATSSNIAAVRTLQAIGLPALLDMAARLGIHSLGRDPSRYGLSLTLGGGEVTLLELTGAYAGFANGGNQLAPYAVLSIHDPTGRVLLMANPTQPPSQAISPQVAYMITNILADPYARMRAFGVESVLDPGRPAAAKTGTTTDWRDNWTIGYTPDRAVGVWVGNADGTPMKAISGVTGAGPVWRAVVQAAHHDIPIHPFLRPNGILEAEICADSGLLPGPHCPATRHEIFMAGTVPTTPDNTHVAVRIDPKLGCQAQSSYPANQTTMQIFRILPPEAELWAIDAGIPRIPRKACPTAQPSSNPNPSNQGPALQPKDELGLMTPARGATYTLSPNVPRERQRIEIAAHGGLTTNELTILIDGAAVAHFTEPPYRTFWTLTPGHHQLVIRARDRNGQQNETSPVEIVVE